ncbi:hypothetical protein BRY73_24605 [Ochrobactrum sp. P6BS-III]|uniref:hypothetical protein n=1 Tax=unclassified Ochrobactrum TaxID=239106 RepID=UPI0009935DF3|nr:hypothetical protein [Ochrobactrum sp. P6BSIII]OOL13610.1 hypothetical protein BRY73_24605 [Ochrobactrum sp. P6BS-III]
MAIPSFIFGQGTPYKTPEQLQEARRRVRDLMGAGPEQYSRPGGWLYALSDGLTGAVEQNRINQGEKYADEQRQKGSTLFSQLMNGFGGAGGAYPSTVAAGGSPTSGAATGTTPSNFKFGENADALRSGIVETAQAIGADPVDLATAISYETAGTFDPSKAGPRTQHGQHRGLIQFGEPQAQQYGVDWSNPLGSQLGANGAVASYFRDRGFKPGMSGLDLYSTINAGSPGRYAASDANNGGAPGSVADKWNNQMSGHRQKALALLGGGGSQGPGTPQAAIQAISPVADPDGLFAPGADVSQADLDFARQASGPEDYTPPAVSAPQQRQAVAPYDFTGNDQLSSAPAMAFAGPGSNFNERWNAGAVWQPVMPEQAYAPGQVITGPDGKTYQNVEQVGGGYGLSPVNLNNGPSESLLRQNDMAFGSALAPQGQAPQQAAAPMGYFPEAPSASRAPIQPQQAPSQPQNSGRYQALAELLSNPFVPEDQKRIAQMMLQQEMEQQQQARQQQSARDNWLFQQQYQETAQARDPLRQAQIAEAQARANAAKAGDIKIAGNRAFRIIDGAVTDVTPAATAEVGGKSINLDGLPPVSMSEMGVPDAGSQNQFLQQLPPALASQVKGISDGRIDISRVTSLRGGERQDLAKLVSLYDPTWDMSQTGARVATRKDYATGEMAKMASSTNLAIQHMAGMVEEHGKLNNSSYPAWNWAANKFNTQTGDAAQRSFETYRLGVADELAKAFKGVGALNQQEVEEWKHAISTSSSPEQLRGAVVSALHMLAARTDTYEQRYRNVMGQDAPLFLTQNSLSALKKMGIDPSEVDPRYTAEQTATDSSTQNQQSGQSGKSGRTSSGLPWSIEP